MLPTGCSGDGSIKAAGIREDKVAYTHYLHKEWAEAMLARNQTPGGLPQYQEQPWLLHSIMFLSTPERCTGIRYCFDCSSCAH